VSEVGEESIRSVLGKGNWSSHWKKKREFHLVLSQAKSSLGGERVTRAISGQKTALEGGAVARSRRGVLGGGGGGGGRARKRTPPAVPLDAKNSGVGMAPVAIRGGGGVL